MPTTYAHYTFGTEVLQNLNDNLKKIISENIDLFNIGLHGPDILFYYGALGKNEVNNKGHEMHQTKSSVFFENARKIIQNCVSKDDSFSYIAGFICHYMLDSECHPFIRQKEAEGYSHGKIEAELDRMFMQKNNKNPVSFKPTGHIEINRGYADCISKFYDGVSGEDIYKALKSMKFYLNFMVAPSKLKRAVIFSGLKLTGNYEKMSSLIMSYEPDKDLSEIGERLINLYNNAIQPSADIIGQYYKSLGSNSPLNNRFFRNFE